MKTILVTGANRGIGFEICRQLDLMGHRTILCSRDLAKGEAASQSLSRQCIVARLDVTDEECIQDLCNRLLNESVSLDVLINNAGLGTRFERHDSSILARFRDLLETHLPSTLHLAHKIKPLITGKEIIPAKGAKSVNLTSVKQVMETNFYGPWRMIQVFLPLLMKSDHGRIINISSGMGELKSLTGDYPAYRLSKSSLNALTLLMANELRETGITVNAMCPGWVRTDMGGPSAPRSVSQGADTAVWLATEPGIPTGKFFRDRTEIEW